jgi:hypothetical protein
MFTCQTPKNSVTPSSPASRILQCQNSRVALSRPAPAPRNAGSARLA